MTFGSIFRSHFGIFCTAILSVSCQQVPLTTNLLQFKTYHDQHPYLQGYFSNPHQHQDPSKLAPVSSQPTFNHDLIQKARTPIYADEFPPQLQPVEFATNVNNHPTYYPLHFSHHKDYSFTDNAGIANKIQGLANALSRNPRPDVVRSYEPIASASEIHQEVCAPPKSPAPAQNPCSQTQPTPSTRSRNPPCSQPLSPSQNAPCSQPLPTTPPCSQPPTPPPNAPCSQPLPTTPPCSQPPTPLQNSPCSKPKMSPKPLCSQSQPLPPASSQKPPCSQPKPELHNAQPPLPAPKFTPPKNPFQLESEYLSKPSFVPVSPLHPSSKYLEPSTEPPCDSPTSPPCSSEKILDYGTTDQTASKRILPVVPAEKPMVYNPFSENKHERIISLPNRKGTLHHRLHADEYLEYPEGYVSKTEIQSPKLAQLPYAVNYPGQYQTAGVMGRPLMYPYVPPPMTKPIPLILPPRSDTEEHYEDEQDEVHYPPKEEVYHHVGRPSKRYEVEDDDEKSWSKDILRDIADRLGVIMDGDDFRSRRFSSRRYPDTERGYYDDGRYENGEHSPSKPARSNRHYYEEDYDNDRCKERKFSRGSSY